MSRNTRMEAGNTSGNGSHSSRDGSGSVTTPPEDYSGMSPSTMLAIIIGSVIVVSLFLIIVVWKLCHLRRRRKQKEEFLRKSKGFTEETATNSLRLKTIGSHYQLASTLNTDEKDSSASEIKLLSGEEKENLIEMKKPFIDDEQLKSENFVPKENEVKGIEPSYLRTPTRPRLDSTYLDVSPNASRRSSHSSEIYNMFIVEQKVQAQNAPLASQDSLLSSLTVAEENENDLPSRVLFRNPKDRPSSEGNKLENVGPPLPQKLFSKHLNKSAVNVRHNNINTNFQKKANRLQVSKSAGCITLDEDDGDFVDISALPLPAKQRPKLPPKQVINKSAEVLQKIDQNFKKSLPEVRASNASRLDLTRSIIRASDPLGSSKPGLSSMVAADDDDYFEPPDYDEPPEPREVPKRDSTSNTRQSLTDSTVRQSHCSSSYDSDKNLPEIPAKIKNAYEPEDYDEPVPLSQLSKLVAD